jgi:hypothetical protein
LVCFYLFWLGSCFFSYDIFIKYKAPLPLHYFLIKKGGIMLKKHSIKSYVLVAGLATVLFLPVTADADKAADRAMKKDGFGLESTRGNNSVADSLRKADGHPDGAPAGMPAGTMAPGMHPETMAPGTMAPGSAKDGPIHPCPPACDNRLHGGPGTMAPGTMAPGKNFPGGTFPGTTADGSGSSGSAECSQTPEDGWQSVTEVRSETDYQIGFDDSVAGRQFSKFDNDSSIVCVAGAVKPVYVGATPSDSNLGAYISSGMVCNLRNDDLSSGGRGVDKLICP